MTEQQNDLQIAWWANNFEELDREIARLCLLCQVRILDHGIIERVLKKDASVCGTSNPVAFAKLHNMLMLYFANREKSVDAVGALQTAQIEAHVVEQLRKRFADLLGKWPPA
jgi:transcriptional regulator with AAA-type ATPase domain